MNRSKRYTHGDKMRHLVKDNSALILVMGRFGIPLGTDFSVWDLSEVWTVRPEEFLSMGRATPFAGDVLQAKCHLTVCDGKVVYHV